MQRIDGVKEVIVTPDSNAMTILYKDGNVEVVHFDILNVGYMRHTTDFQGRKTKKREQIEISGYTPWEDIKQEETE